MNADAFRHFYNYHFAENRKICDICSSTLPYDLFIQQAEYSHGSVRNQLVHLMEVDEVWFSELQGIEPSEPISTAGFDDRKIIRSHWDDVEQRMRTYLAQLQDGMLFERPIKEPEEDKDLMVWQVLLHVANHGTDHRAQLLRVMHDMGIETPSQDFIFYVYDHM